MRKNLLSFSQPFPDVKQVPTAGEKSQRSTGSTQEFLPGATERVSETVGLKAAGTLLALGLWAQVEANEAMETEVHYHWNVFPKKPAHWEFMVPASALSPCKSPSPCCCSQRAHPAPHTSLWYFPHVFISLFPFVCIFHSMIWLLSQLPSCLLALHHVFCLLPCQKALWDLADLKLHRASWQSAISKQRDGPQFSLSRGINNFIFYPAVDFYIELMETSLRSLHLSA